MNNKYYRFLKIAAIEANKSPCCQKHGCIATLKGKIIAKGYNNYRSTSNDGFIAQGSCTCHAEMATVRAIHKTFRLQNNINFLSSKQRKFFRKITLVIVRIPRSSSGTKFRADLRSAKAEPFHGFRSSAPCIDCFARLKKLKIKKIVYTSDHGVIETKLSDYKPVFESSGRKYANRSGTKRNSVPRES